MVGKLTFAVSGLKEFSAGLSELSKAAQKGVLRRVLLKAGKPAVARAQQKVRKDTRDLETSITIAAKTTAAPDDGRKAFGAAMRAGGSKADAVAALRTARRGKGGGETYAEVYIGPAKAGKKRAIKAIVNELGSAKMQPQAYLRPALAETAEQILGNIRNELGGEIAKAAARAAKRAAKKAAKGTAT